MSAAITYFFDYSANNTNTTVKFRASDMIIHIDSDTHNSQNHDYAAVLEHYHLRYQPANAKKDPPTPPP